MNNPKLYQESSGAQKRDAEILIDEFKEIFEKFHDARHLDIGTGSGDVLVEILIPHLKQNFSEIVGADMSAEMVQYSSEKYRAKNSFLKFKELNIENGSMDESECEWKSESFDLITSLYCHHWIQNQRFVISNLKL